MAGLIRTLSILLLAALLSTAVSASSRIMRGVPHDLGDFPLMQSVGSQEEPRVANDGTGFLVAYAHAPQRPPQQLRLTRVSAEGEVLDPFGIGLGELSNQLGYDLAWIGHEYVVVWNGNCAGSTSRCIRFAAVSSDGKVEHRGELEFSADAVVAADEHGVLITWQHIQGETRELRGMLADHGGGPRTAALSLMPLGHLETARVEQIATPSGFLVVARISASGQTRRLRSVAISRSGSVSQVTTIVEGQAEIRGLSVNDGVAVLTWRSQVQGARSVALDDEGGPLRAPTPLMEAGPLVPAGELFLTVWARGENSVVLQTLDAAGGAGPEWLLEAPIGRHDRISGFASSPGRMLLFWRESRSVSHPAPVNQWLRVYDRALIPVAPARPLMLSAPAQTSVKATGGSTSYLHVWEEYRNGSWQIYSQALDRQERPLGWPIDHPYGTHAVGSSGSQFLLAVDRFRWPGGQMERYQELRLMGSDGSLLLERDLDRPGAPWRVLHDGSRWLLIWQELGVFAVGGVRLTLLDAQLQPIGEHELTTRPAYTLFDAAAFADGFYFFEGIEGPRPWPDSPQTSGLAVRIVETAGDRVVSSPQIPLVEPQVGPTRTVTSAVAASDGRDAFIAWRQYEQDGSASGTRSYTALVDPAGAVTSAERTEAEGHGVPIYTSAVWTGSHFAVAGRAQSGMIVLEYFGRSGYLVDRTSLMLRGSPHRPALASTGGGEVVLDYVEPVTNAQVGVDVPRAFTLTFVREPSSRSRPARPSRPAGGQ
jgi:hypothetical protein